MRNNIKPDELIRIQVAIFIVNKHAKTAIQKRPLYHLKTQAILKLLELGLAKRIHLEYSCHNEDRSVILVRTGTPFSEFQFHFHLIPSKEDFKQLKHIGAPNKDIRNPRIHMSLREAITILENFTGTILQKVPLKTQRHHDIFVSPYLSNEVQIGYRRSTRKG